MQAWISDIIGDSEMPRIFDFVMVQWRRMLRRPGEMLLLAWLSTSEPAREFLAVYVLVRLAVVGATDRLRDTKHHSPAIKKIGTEANDQSAVSTSVRISECGRTDSQ